MVIVRTLKVSRGRDSEVGTPTTGMFVMALALAGIALIKIIGTILPSTSPRRAMNGAGNSVVGGAGTQAYRIYGGCGAVWGGVYGGGFEATQKWHVEVS